MRQSPTQAGSEEFEVRQDPELLENKKQLCERLRFVQQLNQGNPNFEDELLTGQL